MIERENIEKKSTEPWGTVRQYQKVYFVCHENIIKTVVKKNFVLSK